MFIVSIANMAYLRCYSNLAKTHLRHCQVLTVCLPISSWIAVVFFFLFIFFCTLTRDILSGEGTLSWYNLVNIKIIKNLIMSSLEDYELFHHQL